MPALGLVNFPVWSAGQAFDKDMNNPLIIAHGGYGPGDGTGNDGDGPGYGADKAWQSYNPVKPVTGRFYLLPVTGFTKE